MAYPNLDGTAPPPQGYPYPHTSQEQSLATDMSGMSLDPNSPLNLFGNGNTMILQSPDTKKYLAIVNDEMESVSIAPEEIVGRKDAHFITHFRRQGVFAFQNVGSTDNWIGILDNKLIGTATGGPYCDFLVGDADGRAVTLESTMYPGLFVGVLPNGTPGGTNADQAKFEPTLQSKGSPSLATANPQLPPPVSQAPPYSEVPPQSQAPPQAQGYPPTSYAGQPGSGFPPQAGYVAAAAAVAAYPPPAGQYPPPPVGQYPPPAGQYPPPPAGQYPPPPAGQYPPPVGQYPPPAGQYPPQGYPPQQMVPQLQGPQIPIGFNIMDSFRPGTVIQLICRGNGYPLFCHQGKILAKGAFGKTLCNFIVHTPAPNVVMLQNEVCKGIYIAIHKAGAIGAGRGNKFCSLRVHVQPDNYIRFESAEFPGVFLNFLPNGSGGNKNTASNQDSNSQFFVRTEKDSGAHSQMIRTPFGPETASNANNMLSGFVIQLYTKANGMYLGINRNGLLYTTVSSNDDLTYFVVKNRGMGIVSLGTRKFPGYRLRMENSILKGKGIDDLNADFRIKDESNGTMSLESVTCPNAYVVVGTETKLNVIVLEIQRFGKTENVTKKPVN